VQTSGVLRRGNVDVCFSVIASEAKQSILPLRSEMDCFVASLLAMTESDAFRPSP
jgi:hypothetical protein